MPGPFGPQITLNKLERDYLLLVAYVRAQHAQFTEALALIEALIAMGEAGADVLFCRAVVHYQLGAYNKVQHDLDQLDRIDPVDVHTLGQTEERARMRSFLRAKCAFVLHGDLDEAGQASLDFYLRRGTARLVNAE